MTWERLFRVALQRIYSQETTAIPILERIAERVHGDNTREVVTEMVESLPTRLGRIEIACAMAGLDLVREPSPSVLGWGEEIDDTVMSVPAGPVNDVMILTMVLKLTRMRQAAYEVAYHLGGRLGTEEITNLLHVLWKEDQSDNLHTSHVLLRLVAEGTVEWQENFRLQ